MIFVVRTGYLRGDAPEFGKEDADKSTQIRRSKRAKACMLFSFAIEIDAII